MVAEHVADGFVCRYDLLAPFISILVWRAEICLKLFVPRHYRGMTQGDLFIWLLPSKLACPVDRWQLCLNSHWAVSLSGTKQLEGQLCRDPSYSFTFPTRLHFITLSAVPYRPLSIIQFARFSYPLCFSLFFSRCWSADVNTASDLHKFNLNNECVLECICAHYAWAPPQSCEDERTGLRLFCLSQSLTGRPHLYIVWSRTHAPE